MAWLPGFDFVDSPGWAQNSATAAGVVGSAAVTAASAHCSFVSAAAGNSVLSGSGRLQCLDPAAMSGLTPRQLPKASTPAL